MAMNNSEKFSVHVVPGSELDSLFHKWRVAHDLQDGFDESDWMRDHGHKYLGYYNIYGAHVYEFDSEHTWWQFRMSWL
jgi:hypothetical protein